MNIKNIVKDKNFKHSYINKYIIDAIPDSVECYVIRCTNPNIYTTPGYYISYDSNAKDKNLYNKCFKTSKAAAIAFFKSEYKFFNLIQP